MVQNNIKIFGYGSLMNEESLKKTIPEIKSITPVILKDYIRIFETKSTTRLTKENIPISVLNLKESPNTIINGVCFKVTQNQFKNLLEREKTYELINVEVESLISKKKFTAFMFIDKFNEKQKFLFNEQVQIDYLKTCINGAKYFGDEFYQIFLETTLINESKLNNIEKLSYLL